MSRMKYSVGDIVALKADLTRLKAAPRLCRIMNTLPSDFDEIHYQVRFLDENFERRILSTEIEKLSTDPAADQQGSIPSKQESWLKPLAIGGKGKHSVKT
ncbi:MULTISPECIES: cold-shock protein [unclassified Rhizobium]|uniref:cold-shock protein n=1 Tax=Rhizobium TaxID=379 RepID=UPI00114CC26E|nr:MULTISPECIES: cold-shock protein [unclassified Rhizobium]QYA15184.1 cold-shock protein [Rhizobium sp. AB2/73]UEQ83949.1 cold-shock protein [Rhizobium sp. AB2/73]